MLDSKRLQEKNRIVYSRFLALSKISKPYQDIRFRSAVWRCAAGMTRGRAGIG
jgi:hypothetical protein